MAPVWRGLPGTTWTKRRIAFGLTAVLAIAASPVILHRLSAPLYQQNNTGNDNTAVRWLEKNTAENTRILVDDVAFAELRPGIDGNGRRPVRAIKKSDDNGIWELQQLGALDVSIRHFSFVGGDQR